MRLDKFLKVSRIIKRREVAKEFVLNGYVMINGKNAKPSTEVKINDLIEIKSPNGKTLLAIVKEIRNSSTIDNASNMYEIKK